MSDNKEQSDSLVTVVIPCYNYAQYVGEAIDSVFSQSYKHIELIVINDGSTDLSLDKLKEKQQRYNFTLINQKNHGITYTRNKGVEKASGDYILQLDADDTIPVNYIETVLKEVLKKNADIGYTPAVNLETGKIVINAPEFSLERLKIHNFIHSSSLVRAKILKKYKYDSNLSEFGYEDWDIFLSMCLDGAKATLVVSTHLKYRIHPGVPSRSDWLSKSVRAIDANKYIITKHSAAHPKDMDYLMVVAGWLSLLRDSILESGKLRQKIDNLSDELNAIKSSKLFRVNKKIRKMLKKY
jgi:glycosyltransferase involved in cell wall biosynthesis